MTLAAQKDDSGDCASGTQRPMLDSQSAGQATHTVYTQPSLHPTCKFVFPAPLEISTCQADEVNPANVVPKCVQATSGDQQMQNKQLLVKLVEAADFGKRGK